MGVFNWKVDSLGREITLGDDSLELLRVLLKNEHPLALMEG